MAYRSTEAQPLKCPRCSKQLPPVDVAACKCGTWLSAFAATEFLRPQEAVHDPVTRWWKVRAPCPICGEKMTLRGDDPGFFQGCDGHGFWIDADAIEHTGLARGVDLARLEHKRSDDKHVAAAAAERERAELARAREREAKHRAEAEVAKRIQVAKKQVVAEQAERFTRAETGAALAHVIAAVEDPAFTGGDLYVQRLQQAVYELAEMIRRLDARVGELERAQRR